MICNFLRLSGTSASWIQTTDSDDGSSSLKSKFENKVDEVGIPSPVNSATRCAHQCSPRIPHALYVNKWTVHVAVWQTHGLACRYVMPCVRCFQLQLSVQLPWERINTGSNIRNIIPWVSASHKIREMFLRYFIVLASTCTFITSRILLICVNVHAVFFFSGLFMRRFSFVLSHFPVFICLRLHIQSWPSGNDDTETRYLLRMEDTASPFRRRIS